jgi:mRNA-degrading endonuclease HigB of HigAB toxin-antitoxin module
MKTLDLINLPSESWRPIEPETGRASNRITERELERIPAWISFPADSKAEIDQDIPVILWDYSPFGFAIHFRHAKANTVSIKEGTEVRLKLSLDGRLVYAECLIQNSASFRNGLRIGLSRHDLVRRNHAQPRIGVPEGECLKLPHQIEIHAETPNPILFGEWSRLRLYGLRPGLKIELLSTDPALPLFIGQNLAIHLALPSSGANIYEGEIIALERLRGDTLRLRMKPVNISVGLANDLAELLTFEAGISPDILKDFGFPVRFFRHRIAFRFVESIEDYNKVLILRRNAYVDIGKRDQDTMPEDMAIEWDKISRILCAFHQDVLVACAGITFPSNSAEILRSETAFPGNKFPGHPPKKTELIEINSLCTHKDYRRGDLLKAIFEHLARVFVLSDRNYIMNLSDDSLLPIYLSIGFKDMHETGVFLGRNHHLIKISRDAVTNGKGLRLLAWNILYGDLMQDILEKGLMNFSPWQKLLLRLRLSFKPLAKKLFDVGQEKHFQNMVDRVKKD